MTEIPEPLPIGVLKSVWQTRKKSPSIHSHFSSSVTLPPGPIEDCLVSPSSVQDPANISSFLCSGPGLGISIWAKPGDNSMNRAQQSIPADFMAGLAVFDFSYRNL